MTKQSQYEWQQDRLPGDPEMDDERDGQGLDEAEADYEAQMDAKRSKRTMGDFDCHPSNEQMEYFKRGGR